VVTLTLSADGSLMAGSVRATTVALDNNCLLMVAAARRVLLKRQCAVSSLTRAEPRVYPRIPPG